MSQAKQVKKVKKYRILKVVFYSLGLPLFMFATLLTAIRFIGHDPFVGAATFTDTLGFFQDYEALFTSSALFGVWIAVGVWLLISLFHLILNKTVKSRRVRMFSVMAFILVVMLGGVLVMDTVFDMTIDNYAASAPSGVEIDDYKTQLSYYRVISSAADGRSLTKSLLDRVSTYEKVYNVNKYYGEDDTGTAGNTSNKPVTYANVISDEGVEGVDISFKVDENGIYRLDVDENNNVAPGDGVITAAVEGNQLIRLAPDSEGRLVINGTVYSHYFYQERSGSNGVPFYVWYTKDMMPVGFEWKSDGTRSTKTTDGDYGKAMYNQSGLLSDGWVFSFDNMLQILEDYYEAQAHIDSLIAADGTGLAAEYYSDIYSDAVRMREEYYTGALADPETGEYASPWLQTLYQQEVQFTERFSMTRGEIDALVAQLGALLGNNKLFDYIFTNITDVTDVVDDIAGTFGFTIGSIIKPIFDQLSKGLSLGGVINNESTMATVIDVIKTLTGDTSDFKDVYIVLAYKSTDAFGIDRDHLYLALVKDNGAGAIGTQDDILLDIDFTDEVIDPEEGDYAFDFDHLSAFLNKALRNVLIKYLNMPDGAIASDNIIMTILNLFLKDIPVGNLTYKGLIISGIEIPLLKPNGYNDDGSAASYVLDLDVNNILTGLLQNWYYYQSAVIKPVWEFYDWNTEITDEVYNQLAYEYARLEKATFLGSAYGSMIGSTLIGDSLGTGNYSSDFGLTNLKDVQQLIWDLKYQPVYFPIYGARDMMLMFSGLVIAFYFLSFLFAEKEEQYGKGELIVKGLNPDEDENAQNGEGAQEGEEGDKDTKNKKDKKGKKGKDKDKDKGKKPMKGDRAKGKAPKGDAPAPVSENKQGGAQK